MRYIGHINTVRFVLEEEDLKAGQPVKVQLSRKKGLNAKMWNAVAFQVNDENDVPKEAKKSRKRKATEQQPPVHVRKSQQKLAEDEFTLKVGSATPPSLEGAGGAAQRKEKEEKRQPKEGRKEVMRRRR